MSGLGDAWLTLVPLLIAHLRLTLIALALGLALSVPLGIVATRRPRVETLALAIASMLQTIPALALLALMVPLLGFVGSALDVVGLPPPPRIGFLPALMALSLYSVLPMLRNTVTGIAGVDPAMREAARGVGMSPWEVLWQVELPLAAPTIVAGVRTATVWVVGMATLATPVGAESLGNPIFAGLQMRNVEAVLMGSLTAAALALALDGLVRLLEVGIAGRSRLRIGLAGTAFAGLALVAGASGGGPLSGSPDRTVLVLGSKQFTEQYVLAEIVERVAESVSGIEVRRMPSLGSTVAFDGLVAGELDVYIDYTGTIWSTVLGREAIGADREAVLQEVEQRLRTEFGVTLLARLGFENTYALALQESRARSLAVQSIGDLAPISPSLSIAGDYEFFERPEWQQIEARYGLRFRRERPMDPTLMYEALVAGGVDVIGAYSTDGRIEAYDLRVLDDDRSVIPPYDAIVLASERLMREAPRVAARLRTLSGTMDASTMRALNAAVDLEGESVARVAARWLEAEAMLPSADTGAGR